MADTDLTLSAKSIGYLYRTMGMQLLGNLQSVAMREEVDLQLALDLQSRLIELSYSGAMDKLERTIRIYQDNELTDACSNIKWFHNLMDYVGTQLVHYGNVLANLEPEPAPSDGNPVPPGAEVVAPPPPAP